MNTSAHSVEYAIEVNGIETVPAEASLGVDGSSV